MYRIVRTSLGRATSGAGDMGLVVYMERMVYLEQAESLVFIVTGRLPVPANLHIVGALQNSPSDPRLHFRVGRSTPLPGTSTGSFRQALTVNLDDTWFPYMGVTATLTDGSVTIPEGLSDLGTWVVEAITRERTS